MANRQEGEGGAAVARLRASKHAVAQRYGDEMLLVHLQTDRILSLNRTGARLWELICAGHDRAGIQRHLVQEFEAADAEVAVAVEETIGRLKGEGLLAEEAG